MDERPRDPDWPRRIAAETFGTFALVFVAVGGDAMARISGGEISVAARAVAPGLMVAALIWSIGDASGAHLNPVVSLAFTLKRLFPPGWLVPYWACQLAGAILAALTVRLLFGDAVQARRHDAARIRRTAVALEAVLTWFLVTVILGTADRYRVRRAERRPCGRGHHRPVRADRAAHRRCVDEPRPVLCAGACRRRVSGTSGSTSSDRSSARLLAVALTRLVHGATSADPKAEEAAEGHR